MEFGLEPQLAQSASTLPVGEEWSYEQKFDGFRAIVFVDGDEHRIQSRGTKDLTRYFPELAFPPGRYVVDGEIVDRRRGYRRSSSARCSSGSIRRPRGSSGSRASCRRATSRSICSSSTASSSSASPSNGAARRSTASTDLRRSDLVRDPDAAQRWLDETEGVIAKRLDAAYTPGKRTAMVKVKRLRTIDCVVMGYRPGTAEGTIGSVILGLYTPDGMLRPVGHSSGFSAKRKRELASELAAFETGERGAASRAAGPRSATSNGSRCAPNSSSRSPTTTSRDGRIRHGTTIVRWRDDKPPRDCTIDQMV